MCSQNLNRFVSIEIICIKKFEMHQNFPSKCIEQFQQVSNLKSKLAETEVCNSTLKKNFLKKIFGLIARFEFRAKLGLRFWIFVG